MCATACTFINTTFVATSLRFSLISCNIICAVPSVDDSLLISLKCLPDCSAPTPHAARWRKATFALQSPCFKTLVKENAIFDSRKCTIEDTLIDYSAFERLDVPPTKALEHCPWACHMSALQKHLPFSCHSLMSSRVPCLEQYLHALAKQSAALRDQ